MKIALYQKIMKTSVGNGFWGTEKNKKKGKIKNRGNHDDLIQY